MISFRCAALYYIICVVHCVLIAQSYVSLRHHVFDLDLLYPFRPPPRVRPGSWACDSTKASPRDAQSTRPAARIAQNQVPAREGGGSRDLLVGLGNWRGGLERTELDGGAGPGLDLTANRQNPEALRTICVTRLGPCVSRKRSPGPSSESPSRRAAKNEDRKVPWGPRGGLNLPLHPLLVSHGGRGTG